MKRQDLYNFVREEIINELTTVTKQTKSDEINPIAKAEDVAPDVVKKAIDAAKKTGKDVNVAEGELEEMARIASKIKLGDARKAELAMKIYKNSNVAKLVDLVKSAGEEGMTQDELAQALGLTNSSAINSDINLLVKAGAFTKPKKEEPVASVEPEVVTAPETEKDEWESEDADEVEDEWEKSEEEESSPEEPSAAELAAAEREAKKVGGKGYAKELSPEEEEKYSKLRKGIEAKVSKLMKMKKSQMTSSDDFKVLSQLIKRDDVKKLFKAKGVSITDLVASVYGK
jgi:hypothetical protein